MNSVLLRWLGAGVGVGFVLGIGAYWAVSKGTLSTPSASYAGCFLSNSANDQVLGTVDGLAIGKGTIPPDLQTKLLEIQSENHRRIADLVDEVAVRYVASSEKGKGKSLSDLPLLKEIIGESITTEDVKKFYEANKQSFAKTPFSQVETMLRRHLEQQKQNSFLQSKLLEIKKAQRVKLMAALPCGPKASEQPPSTAISRGSGKKVDLVFVTDYHCGPCRYLKGSLERLVDDHSADMRMLEVLVPGKDDISSEFLARGAYCAKTIDKGSKFEAYHNAAYYSPVQYDATGKVKTPSEPQATALAAAQNANIDKVAFGHCLESKEAVNFVLENQAYANRLGLTQTPAFFLNGRQLAVPAQLNLVEILQVVLAEAGAGTVEQDKSASAKPAAPR